MMSAVAGLQVVSQIAQRWGTRRTGTGKVVWCELPVPSRHVDEQATHLAAGTGDGSRPASMPTVSGQAVRTRTSMADGRRHGASQQDVLNPA